MSEQQIFLDAIKEMTAAIQAQTKSNLVLAEAIRDQTEAMVVADDEGAEPAALGYLAG